MQAYCNPRHNVVLHTFRFWRAPLIEPFESFITDLRTKAESCEFGDQKDRMIRDKIIFTVTGKLQELLLREGDKLDLKKTLVICRAYEDSTKQSKEISCTAAGGIMTHKIYKVGTKQRFPPKKPHYQATTSKPPQQT